MQRSLLIPVKKLGEAKQRLSPYFSAQDRRELADALWQDFFATVRRVRCLDRIVVVSAESRVLAEAKSLGWDAVEEAEQSSESRSVDLASEICAGMGITALLRLPVDLPLIEPGDIETLFEHLPQAPAAVLTPSRDGTGTNALLRTPPKLFPSRFGPGSFEKHLEEAARSGAEVRVVRNERLEVDLDELADLDLVAGYALKPSGTRAWLEKRGFLRRR